ncbi:hypothetical protein KR054_009369 [Drosophila jambulina]|nr:hypothetical protein KR054_009369 [Drosophila jambulina]
MAAVRSEFPSELNSNPSTRADSLRSLKKHVATCWHNLCKKLQQPASFRKSSHSRFYKIFVKADCSASFPEKSKLLHQFRRIFKASRKGEGDVVPDPEPELWKVPLADGQRSREQLQIVARLFSSTLISTKEEEIISSNLNISYRSKRSHRSYSTSTSTMTIIESNYREVREEYPDIDAEVRAILLSHAQNGITISSIKDEYRKQTGNLFPLEDNITDFLLTIPYVTAECSHNGKRIFNLKPNKENSHLLDMVLNQKQRCSDYSNGAPSIEDKYLMAPPRAPPRYWRNGHKRRALSPLDNNLNVVSKVCSEKPADDQSKAINTRATALPHMAKAAAESNWCYQDNWNHLNNIYQQSNVNAPQQMPVNNQIYNDPPEQSSHLANPDPIQPPYKNHHSPKLNQILNPHLDIFRRPRSSCELKRRHERTPTPTTMSTGTHNDSMLTISSDYDAYLLDFPLMGDDLLLYLARMELKCRFRRYERVLQSGLCVSGQTINGARNRLKRVYLPEGTQIIVNIGSVDILKGRPLVQIEHDFRLLIKEMHSRRFVPILTNLAPLANYCHDKGLCDKVLRFNNFIRAEGRGHLKVIDIHSCLINERGVVRFDCFQNAPRSVSGSKEPYLFWNKIGRQRVLQMIESSLEY